MAYRGIKGSDPFASKTTRNERFVQMSKQEQLIEQKKREIQTKLEERKKKETEEALKKLQNASKSSNKVTHNSNNQNKSAPRKSFWKGQDHHNKWSKEFVTKDTKPPINNLNVFSNDGSFLDQFRKYSGVKEKPIESNHSDLSESDKTWQGNSEIKMEDSPREEIVEKTSRNGVSTSKILDQECSSQWFFSSDKRPGTSGSRWNNSPSSSPSHEKINRPSSPYSPSKALADTSPNTTSILLVNPCTSSPTTSSNQQVVSTSSLPQHAFNPFTPPPTLHSIPPPSPLTPHSIPPPRPMQPHLIPPPSPLQPHLIPPPSPLQLNAIPPPPNLQQLNSIPPPNLANPPPPPPPSQPVNLAMNLTSMSTITVPPPSQLSHPPPPISIPPPALLRSVPPPPIRNAAPSSSSQPPVCTPTGSAASPNEARTHLARMVAQCGDDIEDIVRSKGRDDPTLWFLYDKICPAYLEYRGLVERFRMESQTTFNDSGRIDSVEELEQSQILYNFNMNEINCDKVAHLLGTSDNQTEQDLINTTDMGENHSSNSKIERRRKRKSRWAPEGESPGGTNLPIMNRNSTITTTPLLNICRSDPALIQYAIQSFGSANLSEEDWKKAEDHYKINLLYQDMLKKRQELERLTRAGKFKYEYDSDEDTDGGTWEHRLRSQEMEATQLWADELTKKAEGKHHIGDFLPPDELERFLEKYNALKEGREPDLSDYKEYKLKQDNVGFQMLQKLGWSEGQGLGSEGVGIIDPVNKASLRVDNQGLGMDRPDDVSQQDDEYDAYRKRMMLAYRFRPNPLNNPRRPYY